MVEMKNLHQGSRRQPERLIILGLWRTDLAYFWVINCEC